MPGLPVIKRTIVKKNNHDSYERAGGSGLFLTVVYLIKFRGDITLDIIRRHNFSRDDLIVYQKTTSLKKESNLYAEMRDIQNPIYITLM